MAVGVKGVVQLARALQVVEQEILPVGQHRRRNVYPGLLRFGQGKDDVSGDVNVALVVGPPAPAAVRFLLDVELAQPFFDQSRQLIGQFLILDPQRLQRIMSQHIRQEAADRLLGTFVGIMLQVAQAVAHTGGQAGIELDPQLALAFVEIGRQGDHLNLAAAGH